MKKLATVFLCMLAGCAQHNADGISIDFEPLYPQEMPLVETNNGSGTIFNVLGAIYFRWNLRPSRLAIS